MAIFKNSTASGNKQDGFVTNNPYTVFENCLSQNNDGVGFRDNSGEVVRAALLQSISVLREQTIDTGVFSNHIKIGQEINALEKQVKDPVPNKGLIQQTFNRMKELAKEHTSEIAARVILDFAMKGPEFLKAFHDAGFFNN